jgi:hypothetical protein
MPSATWVGSEVLNSFYPHLRLPRNESVNNLDSAEMSKPFSGPSR